jgi:hypothetical protein
MGYAQQMFILRWLAARFLIDRLFGGSRGQRRRGARRGGYYGDRRGRAGLFGPVPYYSTRTRRGTSVTVGGCCLPFALGMLAVPLGAGRALWRRRR